VLESLASGSWKRFLLPLASRAGFPSGSGGLNCSLGCAPLPAVPLEAVVGLVCASQKPG